MKTDNLTIQSIPELLVETYGNQSELARRLGINRYTLRKHIKDKECKHHCILNGVFMSTTLDRSEKVYENKPTLLAVQQKILRTEFNRRSFNADMGKERLTCIRCHMDFNGNPIRQVCSDCSTQEDTRLLNLRLKQAGMKLTIRR